MPGIGLPAETVMEIKELADELRLPQARVVVAAVRMFKEADERARLKVAAEVRAAAPRPGPSTKPGMKVTNEATRRMLLQQGWKTIEGEYWRLMPPPDFRPELYARKR